MVSCTQVATESDLGRHHSFDLVDWTRVACYTLRPKACIEWLKVKAYLVGLWSTMRANLRHAHNCRGPISSFGC